MPKGSPELTEARRTEIMDACRQLYETMTFKEVNLKEIGKVLQGRPFTIILNQRKRFSWDYSRMNI